MVEPGVPQISLTLERYHRGKSWEISCMIEHGEIWGNKPGVGYLGAGLMTDRATDRPTGRRTILLWTNNIGRWSVTRSDGPSCLLKQLAPDL